MPRNRIIYNSKALYVSQVHATGEQTIPNSIAQLSRIQSFEENFSRNFVDINALGKLGPVDRLELESPSISANFSYYLTDGFNEEKIGLTSYPAGTPFSNLTSCIQDILFKSTDEKNYYLLITEEGNDAANYVGSQKGVIGIGNGVLTSYSINAAVGDIPTADVEIEGLNIRVYSNANIVNEIPAINIDNNGLNFSNRFYILPTASSIQGGNIPNALLPGDITLNLNDNDTLGFKGNDLKIQDFTLSFNLNRLPLKKIGQRFPFSREIEFPITANLEISAEVGDLNNANLINIICDSSEKEFIISMKNPGCGTNKTTALAYILKGAKIISQNFTSSIGENSSIDLTFEVQINDPEDKRGVFISGSYT
jgi:hypothetical protein